MPLILCKKSKKSNEAFLRKLQKTLFLGIFEHISRCTCGAATFFKNPAPSLFCNHGPLPPYQKSEKTVERFLRKRCYGRTDGRTDEPEGEQPDFLVGQAMRQIKGLIGL